jgi:undecaprenyl diphosphate synthase
MTQNNPTYHNLPVHVAVIMDGNGRWAKERGLERVYGHIEGKNSLTEVTETAAEIGIKFLTVYAFSTENWNRPQAEVDALMELLIKAVEQETDKFMHNNVRLTAIGDLSRLPQKAHASLMGCIEKTSENSGLTLVVALSYSSRWEILNAVNRIVEEVKKGKDIPYYIDENIFSQYLTTNGIPDPDLIIRTSGERRISNFLLWQSAYSEFYFTDTLWPDFRRKEFLLAMDDYQKRVRRFGKTDEQIKNNE